MIQETGSALRGTADCMIGSTVISVSRRGPIAWATITRSHKANALDKRTLHELQQALSQLEVDPSVRALVFTGVGRHFCSGADLAELLAGGAEGIRSFMEMLRTLLNGIERSHLVTIAAVNGAARAGGLELALACDVILAGKSATFGDAHVRNGLLPGGGSTARLPRAIGWQRAKWLLLSGASVDATTACEWGLAFDVVNDEALAERVEEISRTLMGADSLVLGKVKGLLANVSEQPLRESLEAEIATLEAHYHSDTFRSGVRAFLSRRKA
jgi:enoyl-CoA hydratase/carnithine racemase